MNRTLSIAAVSFSLLAITSAYAADGYLTGDVNLRAGPDSSYPSVAMLGSGTAVAIDGCVDGWSWCDVASGDNRGWVAGNFLQEEYQGQRVLIPDYGVQIGIPVISFVFATYWDDHYRNRSWYGDRNRWSQVKPQYSPVARSSAQRSSPVSHAANPQAAGAERSAGPVASQPAYQGKLPNAVAPQHAVVKQTESPVGNVNHAKPMERHAPESKVEPKAVTATKPAAEHQATEAKAPPKEAAEHENGKDKDQH